VRPTTAERGRWGPAGPHEAPVDSLAWTQSAASLFAVLAFCLWCSPCRGKMVPPLVLLALGRTWNFADATACRSSEHGFGGVLFLQWRQSHTESHTVVLKRIPDDADAVSHRFCALLCRAVGIAQPRIDVLDLDSEPGRQLRHRVAELTSGATSREESMRNSILESGPFALLMDFLDADSLLPKGGDADVSAADANQPNVAIALGRIAALDMVINNWDRLPLGIAAWRPATDSMFANAPPGNFDNVLATRAEDGTVQEVYAIDTDIKRSCPSSQVSDEELVAELASLFDELLDTHGGVSRATRRLQDGIANQRPGVMLNETTLLLVQQALVEAMDALARLDLTAMHREAMRSHLLSEEPVTEALVARAQQIIEAWQRSRKRAELEWSCPPDGEDVNR